MAVGVKRIVTIQDISCYGQCSLTVALPLLSAYGVEASILPTAILSTHTSGFSGFTFHDLSGEIPAILQHWRKENLSFDAVLTGYLGSSKDVELALQLTSFCPKGPYVIDPCFGDHGALYGGMDKAYVKSLLPLVAKADVLLPNLTEACFLLGQPFDPKPSPEKAVELAKGLVSLGAKSVLLKGISSKEGETGFLYFDGTSARFYSHEKISKDYHGTGDIFASVFLARYLRDFDGFEAGKEASLFVLECIKETIDDPNHPYGVHFETVLARKGNR